MQTLEDFHVLFVVHVDYKQKCYAHSGVNHKKVERLKKVSHAFSFQFSFLLYLLLNFRSNVCWGNQLQLPLFRNDT